MQGSREVLSSFFNRVNAWQRPVVREAEYPWFLSFELHEPDEESEDSEWRVRYQLEPVHGDRHFQLRRPRHDTRPGFSRGPPRFAPISARTPILFHSMSREPFVFSPRRRPPWYSKVSELCCPSGGRAVSREFTCAPAQWSSLPVSGGTGMFSLSELMQFDWEVAIGGENYTRGTGPARHPPLRSSKSTANGCPSIPKAFAALDLWKREPAPAREVIRMAVRSADRAAGRPTRRGSRRRLDRRTAGELAGHSRFEELPPPAGFQGTLRPYQARGFSWLGFLREYGLGACLADDMGLGKTIQALALLERDRAKRVDRQCCLICPTSVVGNWRKEAARFAPRLQGVWCHSWTGARTQRGIRRACRATRSIISSYALLHRDLDQLKEVAWSGIILDEAPEHQESGHAAVARRAFAQCRATGSRSRARRSRTASVSCGPWSTS